MDAQRWRLDQDGAGMMRHPRAARLAAECENLRTALSALIVEKEELLRVVRPHLEAVYLTKFGSLKHELLELQVANRRMLRRIEMIRAALNQGRLPDIEEIERALVTEFREWDAHVRIERSRVDLALYRLAHLLSADESAETRRLFRSLALKLHPDVNPDPSASSGGLWLAIQQAYEAGDLEGLKALAILAEGHGIPPPALDCMEALEARRRELNDRVRALTERLGEIRVTWPFTIMDRIEDEAWVEEGREAIRGETDTEKRRHADLLLALWAVESEAGIECRPVEPSPDGDGQADSGRSDS